MKPQWWLVRLKDGYDLRIWATSPDGAISNAASIGFTGATDPRPTGDAHISWD